MRNNCCVNKKSVRKQFGLERKREAMEAQIVLLRSEFEAEESEALKVIGIEKARNERFSQDKVKMAKSRRGDVFVNTQPTNKRRESDIQRNYRELQT